MFSERNNPEPSENQNEQPEARQPEIDPAAAHEQQPNPAETENQQAEIEEQTTAVSGLRAAAQQRIRQHRVNRATRAIEKATAREEKMDRKDEFYDIQSEKAKIPHLRDEEADDIEKETTIPEKIRAAYLQRKTRKRDLAGTAVIEARRANRIDHTEPVSSVRKSVTDTILHPVVGAEAPTISPVGAVIENSRQVIFEAPIVFKEQDLPGHIVEVEDPETDDEDTNNTEDERTVLDRADNEATTQRPEALLVEETEDDPETTPVRQAQRPARSLPTQTPVANAEHRRVVSSLKDVDPYFTRIPIDKNTEKVQRDIDLLEEHGIIERRGTEVVLTQKNPSEAVEERTVEKTKTLGLTKFGRLWQKGKNIVAYLRNERTPQEFRDTSMQIDAADVHHSNKEWRRVRRAARRREESLNYAADQPVLSWWRNRRREKAQKKIRKAQQKIEKNGGLPA